MKLKDEETAYNTIFMHRGIRPSVRPELEVDSGMSFSAAGKRNQPDTPAPPNRIAAGPSDLKVVGRREYKTLSEIMASLGDEKIMDINQITRRLGYSYSSILEGKVRNFLRKSMFMYLIASLLFFMATNQVLKVNNKVLVFIAIYIVLLIVSVLVMIISSYFQFEKRKHDGLIVSFMEERIYVTDELIGSKVERQWNWIKQVELLKETYYFDLNANSKEVIILRRKNLSEQEDEKLQTWIRLNSKLIV
jgi:hypothetical protein